MPNQTHNILKISGEKEDMKRFYDVALKEKNGACFSFGNVFPAPKNLEYEQLEDWCSKNYGTSDVECKGVDLKVKREMFVAEFNTPWGPPQTFMEKLLELFPELRMSLCYEIENDSCGFIRTVKKGEVRHLKHDTAEPKYFSEKDEELVFTEDGEFKYKNRSRFYEGEVKVVNSFRKNTSGLRIFAN